MKTSTLVCTILGIAVLPWLTASIQGSYINGWNAEPLDHALPYTDGHAAIGGYGHGFPHGHGVFHGDGALYGHGFPHGHGALYGHGAPYGYGAPWAGHGKAARYNYGPYGYATPYGWKGYGSAAGFGHHLHHNAGHLHSGYHKNFGEAAKNGAAAKHIVAGLGHVDHASHGSAVSGAHGHHASAEAAFGKGGAGHKFAAGSKFSKQITGGYVKDKRFSEHSRSAKDYEKAFVHGSTDGTSFKNAASVAHHAYGKKAIGASGYGAHHAAHHGDSGSGTHAFKAASEAAHHNELAKYGSAGAIQSAGHTGLDSGSVAHKISHGSGYVGGLH